MWVPWFPILLGAANSGGESEGTTIGGWIVIAIFVWIVYQLDRDLQRRIDRL